MAIDLTPFPTRMSRTISPWRASDGAVRKNRPSSSAVESAGEVAEGETMTTPLGRATFCRMAPVTPEQSAPMMAFTPSEVTRRSAAEVAAAASTQVESPRTDSTATPSSSLPESVTSFMAISAALPMEGVIDSIGPVKPSTMPIFTGEWLAANAEPASMVVAASASSVFFMYTSQGTFDCLHWRSIQPRPTVLPCQIIIIPWFDGQRLFVGA